MNVNLKKLATLDIQNNSYDKKIKLEFDKILLNNKKIIEKQNN
jgi:hypothetical protein